MLLSILLPVLLTACVAGRTMTASTDLQQTDSVIVRETLRDTVVSIAADSSLVRALIECDSTGRAYLRQLEEYRAGARLPPPELSIDTNNVLTATAAIDSMEIYLTLKARHREDTSIHREVVTPGVEVNHLTWWQTPWIRLGQILAVAGVAVGGFRLFKLVKRT